jgi:hypothetical protein
LPNQNQLPVDTLADFVDVRGCTALGYSLQQLAGQPAQENVHQRRFNSALLGALDAEGFVWRYTAGTAHDLPWSSDLRGRVTY